MVKKNLIEDKNILNSLTTKRLLSYYRAIRKYARKYEYSNYYCDVCGDIHKPIEADSYFIRLTDNIECVKMLLDKRENIE